MTCRRWWLVLLVALALMPSGRAEAQFRFGNDEQINFIQDVKLKGASDEELFLGYMTRTLDIFAGVYIKDLGYVLGVKGNSQRFYHMPAGDELARLQRNGYLPDPLPPYQLGVFDYVLGYSLWWGLALVALLAVWGNRRTAARAVEAAAAPAPTMQPPSPAGSATPPPLPPQPPASPPPRA